MKQECLISKTTKEERQIKLDEALAISSLGAQPPTPEDKLILEKFVEGELEPFEIVQIAINKYKQIQE